MRRFFLSFAGSGWITPAPGTWGSLAALPAAWAVFSLLGPFVFVAALFLVIILGVRAIADDMAETNEHDPSWIVIDEVAGQWIALLPVVFGAWRAELSLLQLWPGILTAFLAFRLFDIWKPGPIGTADARDDAWGVMLDDIIAGVFAALVVLILAAIAHAGFVANVNPA